jgi:hypothetical protein
VSTRQSGRPDDQSSGTGPRHYDAQRTTLLEWPEACLKFNLTPADRRIYLSIRASLPQEWHELDTAQSRPSERRIPWNVLGRDGLNTVCGVRN